MNPYDHARERFNAYAGMATGALPLDRFSALQVRLARWQNRQFPNATIEEPALGVGEELGELCDALVGLVSSAGSLAHAVLKDKQRIRKFGSDPEKLRQAAADAIADMTVFAMQLCTWCRLDFGALVAATIERVLMRDWAADPVSGNA